MRRQSLVLSLFLASLSPAMAQPAATLAGSIELKGEPFDGPPAFEILADGKVVATGEVGAEGRVFSFEVAPGIDPKAISVNYVNDLYGGPGKDRNLVIVSAKIGDRSIDGGAFTGPDTVGVSDNKTFRMISGGRVDLLRPENGWVNSQTEVAKAETKPQDTAALQPPKKTAEPSPAAKSSCAKRKSLTVSGFGLNSFDLPPDSMPIIQQAVSKVSSACEFVVTGFSSPEGPQLWNTTLAQLRAESVKAALVRLGVAAEKVMVAAGETSSKELPGRRVVISVK